MLKQVRWAWILAKIHKEIREGPLKDHVAEISGAIPKIIAWGISDGITEWFSEDNATEIVEGIAVSFPKGHTERISEAIPKVNQKKSEETFQEIR